MQPSSNILDHLADSASARGEDFPGTVRKRWFEGAHGHSTTQELIITCAVTGTTYRVTMDTVPSEAVMQALAGSHPS